MESVLTQSFLWTDVSIVSLCLLEFTYSAALSFCSLHVALSRAVVVALYYLCPYRRAMSTCTFFLMSDSGGRHRYEVMSMRWLRNYRDTRAGSVAAVGHWLFNTRNLCNILLFASPHLCRVFYVLHSELTSRSRLNLCGLHSCRSHAVPMPCDLACQYQQCCATT